VGRSAHRDVLDCLADSTLLHDPRIHYLKVRDAQVCRGGCHNRHECADSHADGDASVGVDGAIELLVCDLTVIAYELSVNPSSAAIGTNEHKPLTRSPKVKAHSAHSPSTSRLAEWNHVWRSCVEVVPAICCLPTYLVCTDLLSRQHSILTNGYTSKLNAFKISTATANLLPANDSM
jgi:hypothetical protein